MKRNDRIVGIDGTAQGRMNSSDSQLDPGPRRARRSPDSNSATNILMLTPTSRNTSVLTTERAKIGSSTRAGRSSAGWRASQKPVADRVEHEDEEDEDIGRDQDRCPRPARPTSAPPPQRGATASASRTASVDMASCPGSSGRPDDGRPESQSAAQPATCLMRAIISSTALSTGTFSLTHAVHRLGPDILVVEDGELVVLGELERHRAGLELVVHRLAVPVRLPERALLRRPWSPGTSGRARLRRTASGSLPAAGR